MSWPDNYGRLWGQIPNTAGQVFWVSPSAGYTVNGESFRASDDNDGLKPEEALLTIDRAWNLVTASAGDVIVLLPGDHALTASIAADQAGVTMMGLPSGAGNYLRPKTNVVGTAITTDQNMNVTAADIEIAYLNWVPVSTDSAIDISAAGNRCHIHHCSFDMATPAANTGTIGIDIIGAASDLLIDTCFFHSDGAQGPGIADGGALTIVIQNCDFVCSAGTWVSCITQAAASRRLLVRNCVFDATSATITNGCLGTTGGDVDQAVFIRNINSVGVTKMVDGYDNNDASTAINYVATVNGGSGGDVVTATT
jgi:hypothetical protein